MRTILIRIFILAPRLYFPALLLRARLASHFSGVLDRVQRERLGPAAALNSERRLPLLQEALARVGEHHRNRFELRRVVDEGLSVGAFVGQHLAGLVHHPEWRINGDDLRKKTNML